MGLELRGGNLYYYRKVWNRGRVKSEYVGGGPVAFLAVRMDQAIRREEEARKTSDQVRWDELRERIDAVDSRIDAHLATVDKAVSAALEVAGFRRRKNRCAGWVKPRESRGG